MANTRLKDRDWHPGDENGGAPTWERVQVAILLDIRDELKSLNALLHCHNFIGIPRVLRGIRSDMKRRRVGRIRRGAKRG